MHPVTSLPILLLVLYFGLCKLVGDFGAGAVVDLLEGTVFKERVSPWVEHLLAAILPWETPRSLFVGEYGIITLGVRYTVALILPIVGAFFLIFSILEDSAVVLPTLQDRPYREGQGLPRPREHDPAFVGQDGRLVL
jgi:ferrous iron transport protein B